MKFLLRRALHSLALLWCASVLSFALVSLAPGDYFESMRVNPRISSSNIAALRSEHGLGKSPAALYLNWARSALAGDWGFSFEYNRPAGPILLSRACNTLLLASCGTALAWFIALPAGMLAATRSSSWVGLFSDGLTAVLLAFPEMVLALVLLMFAARGGFLPAGGLESPQLSGGTWAQAKDILRHLLLPVICLAAGLLPLLFAHVRSAVGEALRSPFIATARSFGIPARRLLWRHAFPAALNSLISLFGLSIGLLISSSLLVEAVFSWPGVGQLMLQAIFARDVFMIVDAAILAACFLAAGNFVSDVLLYISDPRIRAQ